MSNPIDTVRTDARTPDATDTIDLPTDTIQTVADTVADVYENHVTRTGNTETVVTGTDVSFAHLENVLYPAYKMLAEAFDNTENPHPNGLNVGYNERQRQKVDTLQGAVRALQKAVFYLGRAADSTLTDEHAEKAASHLSTARARLGRLTA